MAKYEITSPDGRKFEVTAPDDATQDGVLAYAQSQFSKIENQDGALKRGWNKMIQSVGITGALATGDADTAAQKIAESARYQYDNPGTPEGNELMAAWQRGDGISGGLKEVGGEFAKDWREAPSATKAIRATGANIAAMGSGVVEQMPNMLLPMAGMIGGGAAGSTVGPVGTVGGAWAGASAGNTLVEGGGMAQEALHKAGINPLDTEAVKKYLSENGDDLLMKAGIKGAVIGAVDTATMGIATKLLTGPAKAAAGRALVDMGVDVTDKAAVKAAIQSAELAERVAADPIYKASTTGARGMARNTTAAALEPAGEFTGEYLGQGLATGEYNEKEAFLEAASSVGQSGATFAGQKAYAALKYPFKADKGSDAPAGSPPDPTAADVLGTPEPIQAAPTEAEKALYTPKPITALDRVAEIDAKLTAATPEEAPALQAERDSITAAWPKTTPDTGTLGIPRAEMPQIKGEHRGALIQFLQGRGIAHETVEMPANELKPTQAEFSTKKVANWTEKREGVDRSVLASSDGYILDGHHQWVAALAAGETEKVIRFDVPIQELLAAVREFPSVKKSEGAAPKSRDAVRREVVEQQWQDALSDLGVILRDFAQVARVVPEETPNLMPTLVKLFEAGFGKVGMQISDLMKYVKAELKKLPEFKSVWNKIDNATYRKAAAKALENHQAAPQGDLFAPMVEKAQQGDLFSGNTAEKVGAGATAKITIDQQEYDLDAPNFGVPSAPLVLKDDDPLLVETTMKPANSKVIFKGEEMTRAEMRKRIEDHYFSQAKPVQDGTKPIVYVMGGGGASGKGTIKGKLIAEGLIDTKNTVSLDPDEVKPHIPEYDAIVKAGDSRAAAVTHEESSDIARRVKARATGGSDGSGPKYNLVLDVTLGNPANGVAYLEDLKARGYEVRLFGVTVDPRMAVVRATNRAIKSNRWVPIKALLHAHKGFSSAFERYAEIADQARLYENSNNPILLAEKSNGILEVKDATAYNEIVERSQINERANTLREILGDSGRDGAGLQSGVQQAEQGGSGGQLVRDPGRGSGRLGSSQEQDPVRDEGGVGSREPQEGGLNENRTDRPASAQGQGPGPAQGSGGKRGAARVREWQGGGNQLADDLFGAQDGQPGRLQQDGQPNRAATDNERDPAAGEGDRPGRATGIPAGRDIPAKSGRNYSFGDGDLTYEGGWQKKAAQNVEAVELVKRLESENREATREEQAILAKFIGWGASEIRNSIFGKKLDADARAIEQYEDAQKAVGEAGGSLSRYGSGYMAAHYMLAGANMAGYRYGDPITVDLLAKAKPDMAAKKWIDLRDRLKAVMTEEEWATAERSTQYAHYTSKAVVQAMWKAVERMGFKGGAILEPGAGIGVFPGLMSPAMATNSVYTGIEFDNITGAILKHLFPDERIAVESFVDSALPDNFYDMAIGNPPFANVKILSDPAYKKHAFSLHDYFFAKSVDKVKPGGLMVYVTSRYTMDKQGDKARKYLADRADLIGAIRLPQTAFMKNAGTEVVTDVIFLRKKVPGEAQFADARAWTGVQEIQTKEGQAIINEYFAAHPEMVLGTHSLQGSMYSKNEYTVLPNKETDIEAQFAAAVENLPADIYKPVRGSAAEAAKVREIDFNPKAQKEGNYYLTDAGVLMQREGGVGVRVDGKPEKTVAVVKDFVKLRDALKQAHYDQLNDGDWETSLKALQKEYRAFVKKHGNILQNKAFERKVTREDEETGQEIEDIATWRRFDLLNKINDDPDYTLVEALESLNEETGVITESKFLSERVLAKMQPPRIETPHDALLSALNDLGHVDMAVIADRLGIDEAEAVAALGTAVYESPTAGWQMADEYLSGNVKKKLKEAREAAKADRRFERNIEALLSAQPAPVPPSDITAAIGMNWIPAEVYEQFLLEKTGIKAKIDFNEHTKQWTVTAESGYWTTQATVDWGTQDRNAADILLAGLTGRPIRISRTEGTGADKKQVFDAAATEAANQKLAQMRTAFQDWMWQDGERTDSLTRIYNDKFNTIVARSFDGRHLTLPGASTTIAVRDTTKRGAWRIIQAGNTYLAHAVGSGKTWQMVISAMEQKRLGLIQKPMMVVPNHMLQQFAREWLQLYPAARLMVADEKQFHTDNRRRFVSRVAMSDLDGVIITHSAFKLLDLDPEFKRGMIEEQLDYLRAALEEAEDNDKNEGKRGKSPKVRDIQNRIEKMEQKLEAAMSSAGKDKNVRFDQLGVDMLYVDEAHEFRKLAFTTQRQVKGIDSSGSDRAFDLYMKTRWLEQKKPGRSLVMASGTPVTNTLAELYSVQKFMAPQVLEDRGISDFDSWAAMFGQENTEIEADASGKYSPVTRFTKFVNVPELTQMFREFADVLTSDHLAQALGKDRPVVKDGSRKLVITPQTDDYTTYKAELASRLEASRRWKPSKDEPNNPDPIIKIIGDGRLAAIDMRFIDPSLPADPDSKLNRMIDGVIDAYQRTANNEYMGKDKVTPEPDLGGAQMVFSDLGFGAGVAEHRGFNARAWFEKRLRDAGIPAKHVAFMSDYKKSTAKLKLFQDVNAGRVRILVGSSKNMGTGVNAQQRLVALHHLDTPWYPADLEQREGRIIRQGNKNPEVEIYAYSTKGSYDTVMWQMLASKQRFIDQALSGDSSVRAIDDLTEASQFQVATAMTAGDPRAIQLAGVKADIEKYQRLFRAHEETRMRLRREYDLAGAFIESAKSQMSNAKMLAGRAQDLSGENFTAKAGKQTYDKRAEWGEALLAAMQDQANHGKEGRIKLGEVSSFPVEFYGQILRDEGGKVKEYRQHLVMTLGEEQLILALASAENAVGMTMRATNAVAALAKKPAELDQRIADNTAKREALESRLDAKFQFAQELSDKIKEAEALEIAMLKGDEKRLAFDRDEWAGPTTMFSRGTGSGMALRDLQAVVDRIAKGFKNLPRVHVLSSPSDLSTKDPSQKALRDFIKKSGAWEDVEGATHDGEIYLFASGMADEARAEHVLATHEITHYGLRATMGKDLDAALQHIYLFNGKVRVAADKMKKARGLKSNVEAVEEVLADIPTADLAKLRGWRKVVQVVRNWLNQAGAKNLSARLDAWIKSGLSDQEKADLFVADLVGAARQWVKSGKNVSSGIMGGTRLADPRLADDLAAQEKWLDREAKARGYKSIDDLSEKAYPVFEKLAALWREKHPADALLSRKRSDLRVVDLFGDGSRVQHFDDKRGLFFEAQKYPSGRTGWRAGEVIDGMDYWLSDKEFGSMEEAQDAVRGLRISSAIRQKNAEKYGSIPALWTGEAKRVAKAIIDAGIAVDRFSSSTQSKSKYVYLESGLKVRIADHALPASYDQADIDYRYGGDIKALVAEIKEAEGAPATSVDPDSIGSRSLGASRNEMQERPAVRADESGSLAEPAQSGGGAGSGINITRLSRAVSPAPTIRHSQTANDIISQKAATPRPVDMALKGIVQATRLDQLTRKLYDKAGFFLDRFTPETVKAGFVADYGIPEAVLDKRAVMEGRQRQQLRGAGKLLEKLSTLTRAESRVAYEWMNNDNPQAADYFEKQLPEESVKVLKEVRDLIDQLSQEAIRLGQLSPDAYARNKFAYLHRSYIKHTAELTKGETEGRKRAVAVLGDQYKGRGMTDAVDMAKVKNIAPEWWNRKLQQGKADKQLKGEKFIRLERRAASGEGTTALQGFSEKGKGRLLEVAYWPAGEPIPIRMSTWDQVGTWEVRDTKGNKLVVWRDFTKQEREAMGEIDEARYAIAKTLHGMIHDIETGKYLEWLAQNHAKKEGEAIDGAIVEASTSMVSTFKRGQWVRVPETIIPGTKVKKYGVLAGRYLPGPIWNDVRQTVGFRNAPLGETYATVHRFWKMSKTALSPAVHMNNVMANFVMADWHDVTAGHIVKALRLMASKDPAAQEVWARFGEAGGTVGTFAVNELQKEQLRPLLEALEKEVGLAGEVAGKVGVIAAMQHMMRLQFPAAFDALKGSKSGQITAKGARLMLDAYEAEDQVFRLAAWLKAKEDGASDMQAGKVARKSFLDYRINAPWVQMMRGTFLPFIAFTYRAAPMALEIAAKKPWKLMKLGLVAGLLNAIGYGLSGGDEDEERKLLPEEKAGSIWGLTPKLIRMPWNDEHGSPVFLDVRRWIPVGDIFDTGATNASVPLLPSMMPGGPLALLAEFSLNKTGFTGKPITLETDTPLEKATKTADWLYKAFAPNIAVLPGTYAWTAIANAGGGKTDSFGREQSLTQAIVSSVGIKVGSYPKDVLQLNAQREVQAKLMEIDRNITALKREYQKKGIDADEFQEKIADQAAKKRKVVEKFQERMAGG